MSLTSDSGRTYHQRSTSLPHRPSLATTYLSDRYTPNLKPKLCSIHEENSIYNKWIGLDCSCHHAHGAMAGASCLAAGVWQLRSQAMGWGRDSCWLSRWGSCSPWGWLSLWHCEWYQQHVPSIMPVSWFSMPFPYGFTRVITVKIQSALRLLYTQPPWVLHVNISLQQLSDDKSLFPSSLKVGKLHIWKKLIGNIQWW